MKEKTWRFIASTGEFALDDPELSTGLYLPLVNQSGLISCVTPQLGGDCKLDDDTYALLPVTVYDLHNNRSSRNFWLYFDALGAWSATGVSSVQEAKRFTAKEPTRLEAGFLWQTVTRQSCELGVTSEVTSFVPEGDRVELTRVVITNTGKEPVCFKPYAAVPLFGRGAEHLRDHRHVTSLLHRVTVTACGICLTPVLRFHEGRHEENRTAYGVFAAEGDGEAPVGFCPSAAEFIGEGGSFANPQSIGGNFTRRPGDTLGGCEAVGAMQFATKALAPGERAEYIVAVMIEPEGGDFTTLCHRYLTAEGFENSLRKSRESWQKRLCIHFHTGDERANQWLRWVSLQPELGRMCGCAYLSRRHCGGGGRDWNDLWQDYLARLLMDSAGVRELMLESFRGVRFDGTNAIGVRGKAGDFAAECGDNPRVYMDHGVWPLIAVRQYIDQTGDLAFLLEKLPYFKDGAIQRAAVRDEAWQPHMGCELRGEDGKVYYGTVLEHLLVENLSAFYNVGEHNILRLEHADWNNDMAAERGESAALTYLYCGNITCLVELLNRLRVSGVSFARLSEQTLILLDDLRAGANFQSYAYKRSQLGRFLEGCPHTLLGKAVQVPLEDMIANLTQKADWLLAHLRRQEFITSRGGASWYNGYYDNAGERVEGDHQNGVRMTLTAQVFALIGGVATREQAAEMMAAAERYLFSANICGYRLNTDFGELKANLGHLFAYAYGHKENGAVFSQMNVMYAFALYIRGFVREGYRLISALYRHCADFKKSRIYPGIPEYFDPKGRGMYPYLSGAASWLTFTVLTQMFGARGYFGDLVLEPKLCAEQFDEGGQAAADFPFGGREYRVVYRNEYKKEYGVYRIDRVLLDGKEADLGTLGLGVVLESEQLNTLSADRTHEIEVFLV